MKINSELLFPSQVIRRNYPANIDQGDLQDFEQEAVTTTSPVQFLMLKNVRVSPDSVIYKNGFLIKDSLAQQKQSFYYQFNHFVKQRYFSKTIYLDRTKTYLLATNNFSDGHFHWFCEVLPRLFPIKDRTRDFTLLLPDRPYIRSIALESLSLLGIEFADILFMNNRHSYKIRKLDYVPNPSENGLNSFLIKQIQSKFNADKPAGDKRIYISREKARFRKVINESFLTSLLKDYGFEILNGEDFSLKDQVDIFTSASTIAGIHGAGLTNSIFMHPGGNVVELRKKENRSSNVAYWHLADCLGHKYYYFNGIPDNDRPLVGHGCNLNIDLAGFENYVLKKIDNRI